MTLISLKDIYKIYNVGGEEVRALDGINLEIKENEYVAIMGPSGSGKSTLMNMIGCLDTPTSGVYEFEGEMVQVMDDAQLASIRNRKIGFVFQHLTCYRKQLRSIMWRFLWSMLIFKKHRGYSWHQML